MNKKDIIKRLTDTQLDQHQREQLNQLLHYMQVEGVDTSIQGTHHGPRTKSTRTSPKNQHSKRRQLK